MKLKDLPDSVKEQIRFKYINGVLDAELLYEQSSADEDALTGALGQAISTPRPLVHHTSEGIFEIKVSYKKIRGRGFGAPESYLGADGIFLLEIIDEDRNVYSKGLPFQAKKKDAESANTLKQVEDMLSTAGCGLIIVFNKTSYTACDAKDLKKTSGRLSDLKKAGGVKRLGEVLGYDFLECKIGKENLKYIDFDENLSRVEAFHVVSTQVKKLT